MLEIVGLKAGYGAASVLHGVDFTLKQGQFVGLLGANNAGSVRRQVKSGSRGGS